MLRYLADRGIRPGVRLRVIGVAAVPWPATGRGRRARARARWRAGRQDAGGAGGDGVNRALDSAVDAPAGASKPRTGQPEATRRGRSPRRSRGRPRGAAFARRAGARPGTGLALPRPRLHRRRRLHRPWQLRHQHRRWRQVRIPAALGRPGANLIAMVVQTQSAKLGHRDGQEPSGALPRELSPARLDRHVDSGRDRGDVVRRRRGRRRSPRPQPAVRHPLVPGGIDRRSGGVCDPRSSADGADRRLEAGIAVLAGVVLVSFGFEIVYSHPAAGQVAGHLFRPGFSGTESVLLATGIIGATVMPHVIYLHSALTQRRSWAETTTNAGASSGSRRSTS